MRQMCTTGKRSEYADSKRCSKASNNNRQLLQKGMDRRGEESEQWERNSVIKRQKRTESVEGPCEEANMRIRNQDISII